MMGSGYIVDYCVTALALIQQRKAYEMYVTDALYALTQTLSGALGGNAMSIRYTDWISTKNEPEATEEEIADKIGSKLRAMK